MKIENTSKMNIMLYNARILDRTNGSLIEDINNNVRVSIGSVYTVSP